MLKRWKHTAESPEFMIRNIDYEENIEKNRSEKKRIAAWKENIVKTAAFSMAIKILYK